MIKKLLSKIYWAVEDYLDFDIERTKTLCALFGMALILTYLILIVKCTI